jgi:hypothetical protein
MQHLTDYMQLSKIERQKHLDLDSSCIFRGTTSTHCRGILAHVLDTDTCGIKVDCCHACSNEACSNPKHLYWGTRSENIQDAVALNPNHMIHRHFGERNGQYGVKPWRNNAAKAHPQMITVWKNAQRIYEDYYLKDWKFSSYGKGATYFKNKYGYSESTIIKMWKMFSYWNPLEDLDYQSWI